MTVSDSASLVRPIKFLSFIIVVIVVILAITLVFGGDGNNNGKVTDNDVNNAAVNLCDDFMAEAVTPITGDVYTTQEGVVYRMEPIWDNGSDEYYMVMGYMGVNLFSDIYYHCTLGVLNDTWVLAKLSISNTNMVSWQTLYENENYLVRIGAAFPDNQPTYPPEVPDTPSNPEPDYPDVGPSEPEVPEWDPEPLLESARSSFLQYNLMSDADVTFVIHSNSIEVTYFIVDPVSQDSRDLVSRDYNQMQNVFEKALSGAPDNIDLVFSIDVDYYDSTPEWIINGYNTDTISVKIMWTGEESFIIINGTQYAFYGLPSNHLESGTVYITSCDGHSIRFKFDSNGYSNDLYVNYNDLKNAGFV